jgi:diaminohydroxyphosphoribosylaminopyrimidine deaminase/5-amino-6-(5-phosphoribosylamino)uracil reductase
MTQKYEESPETFGFDEKMMARCLQLAGRGLGLVSPNPMVGAVVVHNGKIIGEGFHRQYGGPHAEVHAIQSVTDKALLSESTIYVSLEPCSHWGKTPPCADLIIENNIKKVVIGTIDSFGLVCGNGIRKLKEAGIEVQVGVLENECRLLNRRFFTFHEQKRPYIILKWAETTDGFLDKLRKPCDSNKPQWITNDESRVLVHRWRTEEDGILIGSNTALLDNPALNVRYTHGKNPTRIILDQHGNLPLNLKIFDETQKTILFTAFPEQYRTKNLTLEPLEQGMNVKDILGKLYENKIQSVIVEGGAQTLQHFLNQNLWDEARRFVGNKNFGTGISAPTINYEYQKYQSVGDCSLFTYFNRHA